MKHSLLLVAVLALVAFAAPVHAQYMFIDTNNDNVCTSGDVLTPSSTSISLWVNTNHNADGSSATCNTADGALTIGSYEFFLRSSGGSVTYGTWTDNLGFGSVFGTFTGGTDAYIGRGGSSLLAAGLYKLGSMAISGVSAGTTIAIVSGSSLYPAGFTSFGTNCSGSTGTGTYILPDDWTNVCGTASGTPITQTTWGQIKNLYK
jgi:hypothetical protein